MFNLKYLVPFAAATLSAQVHLQYLDLGPQPAPCCMVTDANGNIYVAGSYTTALPQNGAIPLQKIIVSKVDPANNLVYRFIFGSSGTDTPKAIAADSNGDLFVVGWTASRDFPLVKPLISNAAAGEYQGFLSKIDPSGNLVFSTYIGGTQSDLTTLPEALTLDSAGNVYITGGTYATDFPVTPGAYNATGNAFVMKIASTGDQILFSTFIGSYGTGLAIAVDSQGVITVAGSTGTTEGGFPATPGAFQTTCGCFMAAGDPLTLKASYSASFVLRLSADGSRLLWSTYLGGGGSQNSISSADTVFSLALTGDAGVVVAGVAGSPSFPVTPGAFQTTQRGANLFVTRLNSTGTALKYSTFLGGSAGEQFSGLQLDSSEHPWVSGATDSPDFPVLPGAVTIGNEFLVELDSSGSSLLQTQMLPFGSAGVAFTLGSTGSETLLGASGSLIQIPPGGLSGISILAQVNAAANSPSGRVSPGEIFSLYGTGLGPVAGLSGQFDSSGKLPTKLAGIQVTCGGIAAPLLYVSANQVNAVVPFGVRGTPAILIQVMSPAASTPPLELTLVSAYPEIFSFPAGPPPLGHYLYQAVFPYVVALNQDGSLNTLDNPAKPDSTVTFWLNGAGLLAPPLADGAIAQAPLPMPVLPVSVMIDTQPFPAAYSTAPDLVAGVLQLSVKLPQQLPVPAATDHQMQVQVGNFVSDGVLLAVQP